MADRIKLWITLAPAIIGLVGVLVGGIITTGFNYWLAMRAEAAAAAKDTIVRASELKTATRLIFYELSQGYAAAAMLVDKHQWLAEETTTLPLDAWQKHRDIIARELPFGDWNAIQVAALAVEQFRTFDPVPRLDDSASAGLAETGRPVLRDIEAGLKALHPYILD